MNGTFLQTRKFINYHKPGKFEDHSLIFCKGNAYVAAILGCVIFEREETELVDYFYYYKGFAQCSELNFHLELKGYQEDIFKNFTSGKRRDCRYSFDKELEFKQIESNMEIEDFHRVLLLNLDKLGLRCVHTTDDLIDLKKNRFDGNIRFYALYYEGKMIAGSIILV